MERSVWSSVWKKKINNNLHTRLCFNCRRRLFTIYNLFAGLCYGPVFPVPLLSVLIFLQLAEVYCSVSYSDGMNIHILLRWPFSFSISFFPTTLLSFSLLLPPLLLYCSSTFVVSFLGVSDRTSLDWWKWKGHDHDIHWKVESILGFVV